jgi:hypothetical protein
VPFLDSLPIASLYAMRAGLREVGAVNGTVGIFEELMDARTLFLTANTESVYAVTWLDLKDGPMVVESAPNTLGILDDFFFGHVTDLGNAGPDRGQGGKFLILPPGYEGEVPDGYYTAKSRTFGNWLIWRGFLEDGDPQPAVANLKANIRIYPLAQRDDPPATGFVNLSGRSFNTIHANDLSFYEEVHAVIQEEPVDALDPEFLGLLAAIGIEKGRPFAPDARMTELLTDAAAVGNATARALVFRTRDPASYLFENSAWKTGFVGGSHEFEADGVRLLDGRSLFFYYATGITPAMSAKMVGVGSQYAGAMVDSEGRALDGGFTYRLRMPPDVPVKDFWSLVLYDNQTRSMLQTDQPFPSLNSERGVVANADGSTDVYFGPSAPEGKESNWIQTIPGKGWSVILRLYGPLEPWFDKEWQPGEIERLDDDSGRGGIGVTTAHGDRYSGAHHHAGPRRDPHRHPRVLRRLSDRGDGRTRLRQPRLPARRRGLSDGNSGRVPGRAARRRGHARCRSQRRRLHHRDAAGCPGSVPDTEYRECLYRRPARTQ